jgi:YD repeat-containing protein
MNKNHLALNVLILQKRSFALIVALMASSFSWAQFPIFQQPQVSITSPEAASIYKVKDVPMDYTSGAANIDIPIYVINEGKISVPISISYNTSGIKVQEIASMVGLGWTLNIGGVITVQADNYNFYQIPPYTTQAAVAAAGANLSTLSYGVGVLEYLVQATNGVFQRQTPEYRYQFGKFSGSFYYDINGKLYINSSDPNLKIQNLPGTGVTTGFIITTDEGIQYTFNIWEGTTTTPLSNPNLWDGPMVNYQPQQQISAFYLTQITDLNSSHAITFKYKRKPIYNVMLDSYSTFFYATPLGSGNGSLFPNNLSNYNFSQCAMNGVQVDTILFSTGMLTFLSNTSRIDLDPTMITQVNVNDNGGNLIRSAVFNNNDYFNDGPTNDGITSNHRLKLDGLTIRGSDGAPVENYSFGYNTATLLPPYTTASNAGRNCTAIDYWGYYNGVTTNPGTIPIGAINSADLPSVSSSFLGNRSVNTLYAQADILTQVQYPTGGAVNFYYQSNAVPGYWLGSTVGGLRISQINYYDNPNSTIPARQKVIQYDVAAMLPTYNTDYSYDKTKRVLDPIACTPYTAVTRNYSSEPIGNIGSYRGNPFYSQVEDIDLQAGLPTIKTIYYYDNIADQYDRNNQPFIEYSNMYVAQKGWVKDGLLNKVEYYKSDASHNFSLERSTANLYTDYNYTPLTPPVVGLIVTLADTYDCFGNDESGEICNAGLPSSPVTPGIVFSRDYVLHTATRSNGIRRLTNKTMTEYASSGNNVETTTYTYDNIYYNLITAQVNNSKGENLITKFNYPQNGASIPNLSPAAISVLGSMVSKNMVGVPVDEEHFNGTNLLFQKTTNYTNWPTVNNITPTLPSSVQAQVRSNPFEIRTLFNAYDVWGNVQEEQKTNDAKLVYLYGYNSQYPVAKIIGSSYAIASGLVSQSILDAPTGDPQLRSYLDLNVRKKLPNALVTTYTYKAMVGMTSQTDPGGRTFYYNYDAYARLSFILDKDQNVLKRFTYGYAGQASGPPPTITAYTNNNLAIGSATYSGSCVLPSVPASGSGSVAVGAITSYIDQNTADQMASSAATAQATAQANALGCQVPLTITNTSSMLFYAYTTNAGYTNFTYSYPNSNSSGSTMSVGSNNSINIVPATGTTAGFQLLLNGQLQSTLTITNAPIADAATVLTIRPVPSVSCGFTLASGFYSPSGTTEQVVNNGTTATMNLSFYYPGTPLFAGNSHVLGTVTGGCVPATQTQTFSVTAAGTTWQVTIQAATGQVSVIPAATIGPSVTVSLGNITYQLN